MPRTVSSSATAAPSDAQVRRGCPLHTLADADRQLAAAAVALGTTRTSWYDGPARPVSRRFSRTAYRRAYNPLNAPV
ncbi:hypothetical protein OHA33_12325 [Streptomyces sp. NBC_00562]|uniref:hypothetical protein n=1 Tax=Streptomyces sp. NBC_00562 TaxID=2975777 RepID=UPI002E810A55|nr:hypothetical protein [Streptomyces sp. NBC_00562]WUC19596.1 hypothetical protein OHA33_12325 [Streptomyces sp. NBC_00562]